jgi:peptidoglycan-associated lipoprotein
MTRRLGVMALMVVATLAACHKKKPAEQPTPTTQPGTSTTPTTTRDTAAENAAAREAVAREAASRVTEAAKATLTEMIFFEYDQADISAEAQDVLNKKVAILRANPNVTLRVDGHADERGTVEYNLALSLRRANAVRDYMTGFGIDVSRLEVTGFGEERPLDPSSGESAWAKNRRAEFQVTRGGDNMVAPR